MKSYVRFLSRNKVYTFVNVVGLSVSLTFVLLILLFAHQELERDAFHPGVERIYSLTTMVEGFEVQGDKREIEYCPFSKECVMDKLPFVEEGCNVSFPLGMFQVVSHDSVRIEKVTDAYFVSENFFDFFAFPLAYGDRATALRQPHAIVISTSLAQRLFGTEQAVGQSIDINDTLHYVVSAVMEPFRHTYLNHYDIVLPLEQQALAEQHLSGEKYEGMVYLRMHEGVKIEEHEQEVQDALREAAMQAKGERIRKMNYNLRPLRSLYFSPEVTGATQHGSLVRVKAMLLAGLIILLFALMNYVNLTVSMSGFRMHEMAMRRLLGAHRWRLTLRIVAESVLLCAVAMLIGIGGLHLILPLMNEILFTQSPLDVGSSYTPELLSVGELMEGWLPFAVVALTVLIGSLAGIAPAVVASSAQPIEVVRGTFRRATKMRLSRFFIIVQHTITIVLIGVSLLISLQVHHMVNAPMGYDTEHLMEVHPMMRQFDKEFQSALTTELKQLACVEQVGLFSELPWHGMAGGTFYNISDDTPDAGQHNSLGCSQEGLELLGLDMIHKYNTSKHEGRHHYFSRSAMELLGAPVDARMVGRPLWTGTPNADGSYQMDKMIRVIDSVTVAGVFEDIRCGTVLQDQYPTEITIGDSTQYWEVVVRFKGDPEEAKQQVREVYRKVKGEEYMETYPNVMRPCEYIAMHFVEETQLMRLILIFTAVALLISLLGLVAMSTYYIQQRRREIAVRKVFGSKSRQVLIRLVRLFMLYVGIAAIIAIPIIYYIGNDWLSQFSYRISLSWWIYALAILITALASFLAVILQSWHAANANPVESIKQE